MRSSLSVLLAALVVGSSAVQADQVRGQGQRRSDERTAADGGRTHVNIVFAPRDVTLIRAHYGDRFRSLPRGQQQRLARGKGLPPGWEKKMQPFPASLERQITVIGSGHKYGIYDGHAVIYDPLTHAILDIVSLF